MLKWYEFFNTLSKSIIMKGSRSQNTRQNKSAPGHNPVPQNKNNLDSREGEEQDVKGDDVTHNRKETKEGHLKDRGKDRSRDAN